MKFNATGAISRAPIRSIVQGLFIVTGLFYATVNAQVIATIGMGDVSRLVTEQNLRGSSRVAHTLSDDAMRQGLSAALQETRKFGVLEYEALKQRLSRDGLNLNSFYAKNYEQKELLQSGLDYIVTPNILKMNVSRQRQNIGMVGIGVMEVDFKFYGVAHKTEDFVTRVSVKTNIQESAGLGLNDQMIRDATVKQAFEALIRKVTAKLHPLRILKVSEESVVTLNYGAGFIKKGDTILVYPHDHELIVDNAGNPIEKSIATLNVVDAQTKFASAHVVSGFSVLKKRQKGLVSPNK